MRVTTTLLGVEQSMDITEEQIFAFVPGIGGFESLRRFALVREVEGSVEWLISLDDPDISFAVIEPFLIRHDYAFELLDHDVEALGLQDAGDAAVRCLLTLDQDPAAITANLLAPLVFSRRTHLARQVVLGESEYSLRARVFESLVARESRQASA